MNFSNHTKDWHVSKCRTQVPENAALFIRPRSTVTSAGQSEAALLAPPPRRLLTGLKCPPDISVSQQPALGISTHILGKATEPGRQSTASPGWEECIRNANRPHDMGSLDLGGSLVRAGRDSTEHRRPQVRSCE